MLTTRALIVEHLPLLNRWRQDRSGATTMTFGLMAIILFVFVGAAIDMGRWLHARSHTAAAVDAAVIAGARILQTDGDSDAAIAAATRFYNENIASRLPVNSDTIEFVTNDLGTSVTATGSAFIDTPFLSLANVEQLPLLNLAGAEFSRAVLAVGGNSRQSLEISMMLDVTGSMAGQKLIDMKAAAKDLVDIVVWEDQSEYYSKVALAPFSSAIQVDATLASKVLGTHPNTLRFRLANGNNATWRRAANCVSERTGAERYTDAAPAGALLTPVYTSSGNCPLQSSPIIPLSNDKEALKTSIDSYVATGTTGGHLGTAWAWYLLSDKWASALPAGSQPASYSKLTELGPEGQPVLRKIAVLMTDGEYNYQYCSTGVPDRNANGNNNQKGNCTSPNGSSTSQARAMCTAMKTSGIEVYAVGFQLGGNATAQATLCDYCASTAQHCYITEDGEQLKQSFRDIALKISSLYLDK